MPCAKFCSDLFIRIWIRTKWDFLHIWIVMETKLLKWVDLRYERRNITIHLIEVSVSVYQPGIGHLQSTWIRFLYWRSFKRRCFYLVTYLWYDAWNIPYHKSASVSPDVIPSRNILGLQDQYYTAGQALGPSQYEDVVLPVWESPC